MRTIGNIKDKNTLAARGHKEPWRRLAITLDPHGNRYQTFLENNKHIQISAFRGINGAKLSKEEIIQQGIATEELVSSNLFKAGRVGCAASHRAIWNMSAKEGRGYFVLEDDCYTHPQIHDFVRSNLTRLMNIDICFFGINTDSILHSVSHTGLSRLSLFGTKHPSKKWIKHAFSATTTQEVKMHRLIKAFGYCAYFISPKGAKKLDEKIFPLSSRTTKIPLITDRMPASGLDRAANGAYSELQAYVCQPFLAYTPNIDSITQE